MVKAYLFEMFNVPAIVGTLLHHHELIRAMFWRTFTTRYRASAFGLIWALVQPISLMIVYTIVFAYFLKVRFANSDNPLVFPLYLLCGQLAWGAFYESTMQATVLIRSNTNLVKRVVFPLEILPITAAMNALIIQIIGFIILIPLAWLVNGQLYWTIVIVPVVLLFQFIFMVGVGWIVASLSTYLPDFPQFLSIALTVMLFLTPVFYPEEVAPDWAHTLFQLNPMAHIIRAYRSAFMTGVLPDTNVMLAAGVLYSGTFLFGYVWFRRTKKGFADIL